ncbi:protein-L-isoaspartate(D-aspartate) O-methyltransferase [Coralliovum pocilloporae]|uniref:protein-L-isoaspartate(D-aspartate) O-methyltransferase n=1 Tax=Coralliovum pocilloporae TaxID=3066369 RepID=UPI003306BF1B
MNDISDDRIKQARFILSLRSAGVNDRRVLAALERVPRRLFLSAQNQSHAEQDVPLPIECGQTTFAPSLVAYLTEKLMIPANAKVLEIGTGSGYHTAILAQIARQVFSLDRYRTLVDEAERRMATLRIENVELRVRDGQRGLQQKGPFDAILCSVAFSEKPDGLLAQLKDGGTLIAAIGRPGEEQQLIRYRKRDGSIQEEPLRSIRFRLAEDGEAHSL